MCSKTLQGEFVKGSLYFFFIHRYEIEAAGIKISKSSSSRRPAIFQSSKQTTSENCLNLPFSSSIASKNRIEDIQGKNCQTQCDEGRKVAEQKRPLLLRPSIFDLVFSKHWNNDFQPSSANTFGKFTKKLCEGKFLSFFKNGNFLSF